MINGDSMSKIKNVDLDEVNSGMGNIPYTEEEGRRILVVYTCPNCGNREILSLIKARYCKNCGSLMDYR